MLTHVNEFTSVSSILVCNFMVNVCATINFIARYQYQYE